ncbi:EamA family transporter RarD [Mycolicibacterium pulveris]|uniref:Protein RarD n=1 Tax=Mycolicibacterium pulveris TaxID=36813 RepID=A0A7I7USP8_MYCPV|nr:EamA family transporter RarD [Mycolicibacterium pulveris]MCV6982450.1 EamA family transporter RarD [Mycolicibacterium pulveris]BBY83893.1 protein RarD [Mycolicibacterium pulveris]
MTQPRRSGLLFGVGAYVWWGLCPGFFLLLLPATATEVLAHRFVWSAVFLLVVLAVAHRLGDLRRLSARTWLQLLAAAAFIGINWGTYIWAVTNEHVVDAALGYFINPLISVALGVVIFRERLGAWQLVALSLAVVAVGILTAEVGEPPYIALVLAVSFGLYGLIKKVVDADPRVSVTVETLWGLPVAVGYLAWLQIAGQAHFVNHGPGQATLLLLAGPVTAIPLLLFAAAAQRLPLVTLGVLFYLNPALQMAWGVAIGDEPMPPARWLGFALIWAALVVFSVDAMRRARADRRLPALTADAANL